MKKNSDSKCSQEETLPNAAFAKRPVPFEIVVEVPRRSDAEAIVALVNSDPKHLLPRQVDEVRKEIYEWRVVKHKGEIVACAAFDYFSPRIAEIRSLIVKRAYRGMGIAEKIVEELVKLALPNQQVFVVTSNPKFFRKLNFSDCLGEKYVLFYKKEQ
jgi:N-acetylglutamate synthase-like GNAT family acetyltransferase